MGVVCSDGRLQHAINFSSNGDTVLVYPGTYRERISFNGTNVLVISAQGSSVTTIDGAQQGTVVTFSHHENRGAILDGFTIEHGNASGIVIEAGASPTIIFDVVTANSVCFNGAGISVTKGAPLIIANTITANFGGHAVGCSGLVPGGGIYARESTATITQNTITDNRMDYGAGIFISFGAVTITDNIIEGNDNLGRGNPSGLALVDSQAGTTVTQNLIANNRGTGTLSSAMSFSAAGPVTFVNNTVVSGSEVYAVWIDDSSAPPSLINNIIGGGPTPLRCGLHYAVNPYLSHNDVYGPSAPTGVCAQLVSSNSNISAAPVFVDAPAGNYREQATSPTVSAGESSDATHPFTLPPRDLDGYTRIGYGVDMGAFQYVTVPGAPSIGTATRGVGSVSVTFASPSSSGRSPILDYQVTCTSTSGGVTGSSVGSSSPIVVTGLTSGATYRCIARARNAVGLGAASAASNAAVPTPPPPGGGGTACAGSSGSINSALMNNGVGGAGLLLAKKSPQQFKATASGQACSGAFVTGARTRMTITTNTPVNCQTLPNTPTQPGVALGGSGTFTWAAPAGMGTTNFNVRWLWIKNTMIHFAGSISAAGSTNNLFRGRHISGNLITTQSLAARAAGGNCSTTIPLTHFDITRIVYLIH